MLRAPEGSLPTGSERIGIALAAGPLHPGLRCELGGRALCVGLTGSPRSAGA